MAGSDAALPNYDFSSIRGGVKPEIDAVGTVVLLTSLVLMLAAQLLMRSH